MFSANEMNQEEIVELSIKEAEEMIKSRDKVLRLSQNPDFKDLILEGYFQAELTRLAKLMGDPNIPETFRECCKRDIHGPGALERYLEAVVIMGNNAETSLEEYEETLEELRSESGEIQVYDDTAAAE